MTRRIRILSWLLLVSVVTVYNDHCDMMIGCHTLPEG